MTYRTVGTLVNDKICTCVPMCFITCQCDCQACNFSQLRHELKIPQVEGIKEERNYSWVNATSSNIRSYRYKDNNLEIIFTSGSGQGFYLGVSQEDYEGLNKAPSKGKYINLVIKPKYEWKKRT